MAFTVIAIIDLFVCNGCKTDSGKLIRREFSGKILKLNQYGLGTLIIICRKQVPYPEFNLMRMHNITVYIMIIKIYETFQLKKKNFHNVKTS